MAQKIKLTRPELKKQRDALERFSRYLPMLKLKQQQLQLTMRKLAQDRQAAIAEVESARSAFDAYRAILKDPAGVNLTELTEPTEVQTSQANIAGVTIPVYDGVVFHEGRYSLFATPPWVDRAVIDLRRISECAAKRDILDQQYDLLHRELTKIIQRVNLFEKVMIPQCREIIRRIRIKLGDEMASAVGRAKIAKGKLAARTQAIAAAHDQSDHAVAAEDIH